MGINPHSAVAIAQTVAYVPIVPMAIFILIRNRSHPPVMAWYPFILFSMMRLAGGPVVLAFQNHIQSTGLLITALILLNVGVIPLLVATFGLIRLILTDNPQLKFDSVRITALVRLGFIVAATLIVAGGGLAQKPEGRYLTVAGNALFAVILVVMILILLLIWRASEKLIPYTKKALSHTIFAMPLLVVRTAYTLADLATASNTTSVWNPVYGSAVLFAVICLVTEYIVLCLYMWIGLSIPRMPGKVKKRSNRLRSFGSAEADTGTPILP